MPYIDANQLAAAGFYYTNWSDVVCCAFCDLQVGSWEVGGDVFEERQRWIQSCGFVKGLFVGNNPIRTNDQRETSSSQQQPNSNCGVKNFHMQYRPNSRSERSKYIFTLICLLIRL